MRGEAISGVIHDGDPITLVLPEAESEDRVARPLRIENRATNSLVSVSGRSSMKKAGQYLGYTIVPAIIGAATTLYVSAYGRADAPGLTPESGRRLPALSWLIVFLVIGLPVLWLQRYRWRNKVPVWLPFVGYSAGLASVYGLIWLTS
jgi:hypothetical protein